MTVLCHINLGRAAYDPTLAMQKRYVELVKSSPWERAYLLTVRHDPAVITLGRGADARHVLASPQQLARRGIEVRSVARGGDVAMHGPGQLVGYPILRLDLHGRDIHRYVRDLEGVLIRLLERLGIAGARIEGLNGVWVGREKIAAVGVAVGRWVTSHGFSLNVRRDLTDFELIVPCGLHGVHLTSVEGQLGHSVLIEPIQQALAECFAEVFGFAMPPESHHAPASPRMRRGWAGSPPVRAGRQVT